MLFASKESICILALVCNVLNESVSFETRDLQVFVKYTLNHSVQQTFLDPWRYAQKASVLTNRNTRSNIQFLEFSPNQSLIESVFEPAPVRTEIKHTNHLANWKF